MCGAHAEPRRNSSYRGRPICYTHAIMEPVTNSSKSCLVFFLLVAPPKQTPLLRQLPAIGVQAPRLPLDDALRLLERNTQALGAHARRLGVLGRVVPLRLARAHLLDLVFAFLPQAEGDEADVLGVQSGDEGGPGGDLLGVGAEVVGGAGVEVALDGGEERGDLGAERGDGDLALAVFAGDVAAGGRDEVAGGFAGAEFEPEGHAFEFPVVELPAGGIALARVGFDADVGGPEHGCERVDLVVESGFLVVGRVLRYADGDDDDLVFGDLRRDDKTAVVAVDHHHDANDSCRETP